MQHNFRKGLIYCLLLTGCGDESDSGSNDYDWESSASLNKPSPVKSITPEPNYYSGTRTATETAQIDDKEYIGNATSTKPSAGKTSGEPQTLCLSDCNLPPKRATFSFFGNPKRMTPEECSVESFSVIDNGFGLTVLYGADCIEGRQLYIRRAAYDGSILEDPQVVSEPCHDYFYDVSAFAVDNSPDGSLLTVFSCRNSSNQERRYSRTISQTGDLSELHLIDSNRAVPYGRPDGLKLAWNPRAGAYALAEAGYLRIIDRSGIPIGGRIAIGEVKDYAVSDLKVIDGSWYIFQRYQSSYWSDPVSICSQVSSAGVPLCNAESLPGDWNHLGSDSRMYGVNDDGKLVFAPFNPRTCATGTVREFGSLNDKKVSESLGSIDLGNEFRGSLVKTEADTLAIAVIRVGTVLSHESTVYAATVPNPTDGRISLIRKHVVVTYVSDGKGYLKLSDQELQ